MSRKLSEAEKKAARIAEIERFRTGPVMAYINAGHTRHQAIEHFRLPAHVVNRIVRLVTGQKADGRDKPSRARQNPKRQAERDAKRDALARKRAELDRYREDTIRSMRGDRKTTREIAVVLGVNPRRVCEYYHKYGIQAPDPPPRPPKASPIRISAPRLHRASAGMVQTPFIRADEEELGRRSRISTLITADRNNRRPPPVTLPRVSILEGNID